MQSHLGHVQVNVQPGNIDFYRDLFTFLGWKEIAGGEGWLGIAGDNGASLWFIGNVQDVVKDYDGPGMNHLGINVGKQEDVDAAAQFVAQRGIEHLFSTPRHRPDFSGDGPDTYYQVMFETPDRILMEIVYIGPKSA